MRRYLAPFNGKRYVLNYNTQEIHDLDNETQACLINLMSDKNVYNCDTYEFARVESLLKTGKNANGCKFCLPSKNTG